MTEMVPKAGQATTGAPDPWDLLGAHKDEKLAPRIREVAMRYADGFKELEQEHERARVVLSRLPFPPVVGAEATSSITGNLLQDYRNAPEPEKAKREDALVEAFERSNIALKSYRGALQIVRQPTSAILMRSLADSLAREQAYQSIKKALEA